jgi:hypothetical protein
MTPDKIKEGFGAYEKEYWDSEALCGKTYREWTDQNYVEMATSYQRRAWQACAEWMLSQAASDFNEWWLVYGSSEKFQNNRDARIDLKEAWGAARLSSAKEIMEKDVRIKQLEGELLKAFPMIKFLPDYAERFPFATKLVSKKEST